MIYSSKFLLALMTNSLPILLTEGLNPAIPKAVNLIIFSLVLFYLLRKPTREFFSNRLREVRGTLERAARDREEATKKMAEIDARLARLDLDLAEIKAQGDREAQAEEARLTADAAADAERLRLIAQREIEAAKQTALAELRTFAAEKSVDLAEQIIRRELTVDDDRKLVEAGADFQRAKGDG